jgi:hypothetical protein
MCRPSGRRYKLHAFRCLDNPVEQVLEKMHYFHGAIV